MRVRGPHPEESSSAAGPGPAVERAGPAAAGAAAVLGLHRTAGNAAVARIRERETEPAGPAATRGRTGSLPYPAWDRQRHVWAGPDYGAHDGRTGGTSVAVVVGPSVVAPGNTYLGGPPQAGECSIVEELNGRDGGGWVKGHLWNDNLGGPGISRNMTPMTNTTNSRFNRAFEEPVKRMLLSCARHAQSSRNEPYWYGVRIQVSTYGRMSEDRTTLEYHVPEGVDHSARYVTIDKLTGAIAPAEGPHAVPPGFAPEQP
ncbi:hypothetical protein ACFQ6V_26680 [Streptomyces roseifaciens]